MNCSECRSDGTIQCIACLRGRLRETAQILIATVGADGPMDAEDAARKTADKLAVERRYNVELQMRNRVLQKRLESLEFACEAGLPSPIPEGASPLDSGRPEIGAPDLAPLLLRGNTVIVIRMPPIDLPPSEYVSVMRKVRTDTLAWLAHERIRHSGVLILAPGWEVSTVPREDLRALLDGDKADRVERAAEAIFQKNFAASSMTGPWRTMSRRLAEDALAAAEGEHVCALDNGEAEHTCFCNIDGMGSGPNGTGNCDGDGWFRCPECVYFHVKENP